MAPSLLKNNHKNIGIVGVPPLAVIRELNDRRVKIHDLDTPLVKAAIETTTPFIPEVYCAILRTVVLNALHLALDAIYIDIGPGKCDCAMHVATILADTLDVPIIPTRNEDRHRFGNPLCESGLPLLEKFLQITKGVQSARPPANPPVPATPTAGFWGVPPRDFSILELFPDTTHIYGWTRCMENKTPAAVELEAYCNPAVPTIFYAQSFCAKTALAKHLARQHPHGLYLDCDLQAGSSAKAKIQAFLELAGVFA
ncbi:MAG: hypothetical protein A2521_13385 [Deltaproteobacteria bacterium RIFOXYD12_FULL_57_12]|nr:MAG: hypothetical protein A2521_13385 [Deltaproteobacteria bacterium RIFOXYD12_FULL_57_12]